MIRRQHSSSSSGRCTPELFLSVQLKSAGNFSVPRLKQITGIQFEAHDALPVFPDQHKSVLSGSQPPFVFRHKKMHLKGCVQLLGCTSISLQGANAAPCTPAPRSAGGRGTVLWYAVCGGGSAHVVQFVTLCRLFWRQRD